MFDDYSLPVNYGYGDGDPSQLAGLSGTGGGPAYAAPQQVPVQTIPERPKMRVVPNPGEYGYADATSVAIDTAAENYGYGATKTPARLAAEQAVKMPTVSASSSPSDIGVLQDAINGYAKRSSGSVTTISKSMKWDGATVTALNQIQAANGMPQVPQATPRLWAILFGDSKGFEFDKLERKEGIISGIEAGAEGVLSILQNRFMPSSVSNTSANAPGQQVSDGKTEQQGGTDWTTYALIAGGILLVGGAVYFAMKKDD